MKEEGLIDFNKNVIKILDEEALEYVLKREQRGRCIMIYASSLVLL